jgi:hypothetical protein
MDHVRFFGRQILVLCLALSCASCSTQNSLSRPQAAKLIKKSVFGEGAWISFGTGTFCWGGTIDWLRKAASDSRMYSNDPQALYLMTVGLEPDGLSALSVAPNRCYVVNFTPKGFDHVKNGDWKEVRHEDNGNVVYKVQVSTTELTEVTGIVSSADKQSATADFNWTVTPTSQGTLFYHKTVPTASRQSKAGFQLYDDGWRMVTLDGQSVSSH